MAASQSPLSSIPTDTLILTLLQELSTRIEGLESQVARFSNSLEPSNGVYAAQNNVAHSTEPVAVIPQVEASLTGDRPVLSRSNKSSDDTILVLYGQLLDHEPLEKDMKTVLQRLKDVDTGPKTSSALSTLGGIIQPPADYRIALTNFCHPDPQNLSILEDTAKFMESLRENRGSYIIRDFDCRKKQVQYEYGRFQEAQLDTRPVVRTRGPRREQAASPWQRLILLQGLSEMSPFMTIGYKRPALTSAYLPIAKVPFFTDIWADSAVNMHLSQSYGDAIAVGGGYRFHLSWFRVTYSMWDTTRPRYGLGESKLGKLYGANDTSMCQEAYTIHAVPAISQHNSTENEFKDAGSRDFQCNWTILLLTPLLFYRPSGLKSLPVCSQNDFSSPLQLNVVELIEHALGSASRGWRSLQEHIDQLLGTGAEIFDPDLHDSLLFDDELFSGSRKYFWLINSLHTFDKVIQQNIEAWTSYRDKFLLPLSEMLVKESEPNWKAKLDAGIAKCNRFEADLRRLLRLFRDQRDRTLALREGLFSASAVIESRASTRLGENVKLLTYVSIFYLPLSFCTSLWSTTDTFNFTILAYVTVIVALSTYILVFNLNNIAGAYKNRYQRFKYRIIGKMMKDEDAGWEEIGMRLNRHRPRSSQEEEIPSQWWVLAYQGLRLLRSLRIKKRNGGKRRGEAAQEKVSGISTGLTEESATRKESPIRTSTKVTETSIHVVP